LNVRIVELPLRHAWTISRGTSTSKRNVLDELRDGDLVGRGEAAPNVRYGESAETVTEALGKLAPVLEGDPRHFRVLSERLEEVLPGNHAAKAALDIALHDLAGKRLGTPLYRMLGLDPSRMPVTSFSIGIDDPESMARKVREAEAFPSLKIKLGAQSVREMFGAVRSATPKTVRVDANEAWTPEEALKAWSWWSSPCRPRTSRGRSGCASARHCRWWRTRR
jgi:L-alanine-DL-glutamate epimerase-like enolase superfamily enzyme